MKKFCFDTAAIDMFFITAFLFLWEFEFIGGTSSVAVVDGAACLNWTITDFSRDTNRYIRNPADNRSLFVFYSDELVPASFESRATFTGDLSKGIVSFNLSRVKLSDAGKYTFAKDADGKRLTLGGQVLVVAESPNILGIISLTLPALAGRVYRINCSSESRSAPLDHNLTMRSEWNKSGVNITMSSGYSVNGTILTISNLSRMDNGDNVTCRTFEDQRKISAESNALVLNVLYGPDNVQVSPSGELTVSEGGSMNITCTGECNPPCSTYQWQKDSLPTVVGSSQSYLVSDVKRNNSGVYTCSTINTNISKNGTAQIRVRVIYGPDTGSLSLSPNQTSYEPVESLPLSVNCSADCYPNCQYRWTGPGYSGNTGVLLISEIKRNQSGVFTCTAMNPNIPSKSATANISVIVVYGPDTGSLSLSPNQTSYEPVEYLLLSVNCSVDCYPNCQYRWTGPGYNENTRVLSIHGIKRNQTGVFTCTATNPAITSKSATATIPVAVVYGPDTPLQLFPVGTSYRPVEGKTLPDINCTSKCYPSCEFSWAGPISSVNGVISFGIVNKSMKGNYTCSGKNPRTQAKTESSVVTVTVIYGPDTPFLTPSTTEYTLNESNILPNIQCSTDCFPDCTSYWYKEQTKVPGIQADMLSLGDVYRNDSGTYTCKSENLESRATSEKVIQLIVQYPPTVSIEGRNGSVSEMEFMINCTAHGIPERYNYSLIHSSLFSGIKIQHLIDNEPSSKGVLVHWLRNPSFMDTGVYTCIVRNGIMDYRDSSVDKNASVAVWIEGPPNVTSSDTDFYTEKGHPGTLVIEFYNSMLNAMVTWNIQRNYTLEKLESSDKYNISVASTNVTVKFYSILIQQPGFKATLEIQNVTEEDFGSYQVYLQNSAGNSSKLTLNLKPRGPPEVPKDVHIVLNSITTSSVDIEWVSGFHGGSNQTFVIEYKPQEDKSWTIYSHDVFGAMVQNKSFNITIEDLQQNTLYFFQLYAWNMFNRSKYSTIINATTYAESNKRQIANNRADEVIIGGAVGAVVLLSIAVTVVIILYRRRSIRKLNRNGKPLELDVRSEEKNDRESGLVDNPVYEASDARLNPSASKGTTVAEYAAVDKTKKKAVLIEDPSNLYAQVDKTNKNGKKGAAKGKHGKTSRGDIYENIDLGGKTIIADSEYENSRQPRTEAFDGNVNENPGAVASKSGLVNKDGLLYADLMLGPSTTKNGKVVIHGIENRTKYADIAYGKRGEPYPDSDEDKIDGMNVKK